ncbi:probable serine/threonine-protein kinase ifkA [Argonauta hians]
MSGRGSWNKRSTVGVIDFNEDRKKRYKHKRSQFYAHKTAHFTTTGPPAPQQPSPSTLISSSSSPVASLTPQSPAGSTMLSSSTDRSNNNTNNNKNSTTTNNTNNSKNNNNNSVAVSHSVLSPNPSLCATSMVSPTSTTSTPISLTSSSQQPAASTLLSRPLLSAVQKPSATSSNNVNSGGSNMHHHHHHRQQHLQIHHQQQQQQHPHHHQPHHRHISSVNNSTGLIVDNNNTSNNINNSPTAAINNNNISAGGIASPATGNLNCRRLPINNSMNVTGSASTSLTSGVANMGLGSNSPTSNNNSNTSKCMPGSKAMMMMSPCNMGSTPSNVAFHPLGLRNDVLASRLHSLCSVKSSPNTVPSSSSSVSMMPLPNSSNIASPNPNVGNNRAMTTTTTTAVLANTTTSTGIISGSANTSNPNHATGISSLNNLKSCLPDGNSINNTTANTNTTTTTPSSNNTTNNNNNSNSNNNIHNKNNNNNNNNNQVGFGASGVGSNNNTSSKLQTTTSGRGPIPPSDSGKTTSSKNTRRHHHMATDRIYEFESSPPTSEIPEGRTPQMPAVAIDSQQRKPIWSPAKAKSHENSKAKDNLSDSDSITKEQTMLTPDSDTHIELRRGRSTWSQQNNSYDQRPVRKCSEFNETQLAFLESQWQLGMVSVTRDCWKMIDDTAECIGISTTRIKRWIQEYSKAHGLIIDEPVTRKRKSSDSKIIDDFGSDTGADSEDSESPAKKSKKSSRGKTKDNKDSTEKKENKREQIVGLLGKLSHTCSSLSSLGVETACLAVNKPVVFTLGSKYGTNFLKKEKQLQNKFLTYLAKGKDQPKNNRKKLAEEVKALFNDKFSLCCGSTRTMPYIKLEKDPMFIDIEGFPDGIILKRPQSYGITDLRKILNASDKIQFHLKNPQPNKKKANPPPTPKKEDTSKESTESNLPPPSLPARPNDTPPSKDLRIKSDGFGCSGNKRNNSTPPTPPPPPPATQLEPERPQLELNKDTKSKPEQLPKFGTVERQFSPLPKAFQTSGNTPGNESFLHSSYMTTNSNTGSQVQNPSKPLQMRQSAAFGSKAIVSSPTFLQHRTTFGSGSSRRKALELARSEQKALEEKSKKVAESVKLVEQSKPDFHQNSDIKSVAKFDISSRSAEASKFKPVESMQIKSIESSKFKGIEIAKFKPIDSAKFKPVDSKFKPVESTKPDKKSTTDSDQAEKKKPEAPKSQKKESENTKSQKSKSSDAKSGNESEVFIVEKVLKKRVQKGHQEVLVKWKGYSNRYNSWEPMDNIFTM